MRHSQIQDWGFIDMVLSTWDAGAVTHILSHDHTSFFDSWVTGCFLSALNLPQFLPAQWSLYAPFEGILPLTLVKGPSLVVFPFTLLILSFCFCYSCFSILKHLHVICLNVFIFKIPIHSVLFFLFLYFIQVVTRVSVKLLCADIKSAAQSFYCSWIEWHSLEFWICRIVSVSATDLLSLLKLLNSNNTF